MTIWTRRRFGQAALAAVSATLARPKAPGADPARSLVAREGMAQLAPAGYPATAIWGYDGGVPGPVIRLPQGGRLVRAFRNDLPQPSTIHWHGIRIDNGMDGVPGLTQAAVAPGEIFTYAFDVPDAGTYWYHPHQRTFEQMARGLSGALIVGEASGGPDIDGDEVLVIDDWRLTDDAQIAPDFGALHDRAHAGRIGNWITVNGSGNWTHDVRRHERLRLRLVNAANARIFAVEPRGLSGWVVALDGMPLDAPTPLGRLVLAPAQRADVIVDVTAEPGGTAMLVSFERDGGYALAGFPVRGAVGTVPRDAPGALPPNPVPALGPSEGARSAALAMTGGAMGRMEGALLGGQMTDLRDLAAAGRVWALNGRADMEAEPLLVAARGETVHIGIANDTAWPHAMHLHGHHFRAIGAGGAAGPLRDTILLDRGERVRIGFVADNPGDWLLHCHMLEHAASGMTTIVRVT